MVVFAPDVSEFQVPVDDSFNREWLIFRACFGANKIDAHAAHNLAWAVKARASGKIRGFSVYVVYLPGASAGILKNLNTLGVPDDCVVMIDVETWRGQPYEISGNHSAEINALASALRQRQRGRSDLVWDYGNQGDLAEVHPNRPDWLGVVVAGYGFKLAQTTVPNMLGQQYTDGVAQFDVAGWPSSTPPFGRCDHNVLYNLPEEDVPTAAEIATAVAQHPIDAAGNDIATYLRRTKADTDALQADVDSLQSQLAAVKSAVAAMQTAGVDPDALAKAIVTHLALVAK